MVQLKYYATFQISVYTHAQFSSDIESAGKHMIFRCLNVVHLSCVAFVLTTTIHLHSNQAVRQARIETTFSFNFFVLFSFFALRCNKSFCIEFLRMSELTFESILIQVRDALQRNGIKLWEVPYYLNTSSNDTEMMVRNVA